MRTEQRSKDIVELHTDVNVLVLRDGSRHRVHSVMPYQIGALFNPEQEVFAKRVALCATRRLARHLMRKASPLEMPLELADALREAAE